jgi:predicted RNA-binding Zn-ribbon protein involved in translation (DUF1610 family)
VTVLIGRCPLCGETQKPLIRKIRKGFAEWACVNCTPLLGEPGDG